MYLILTGQTIDCMEKEKQKCQEAVALKKKDHVLGPSWLHRLEGCLAVQVQKPSEDHVDHAAMADNHDRLAGPGPNELVECLPDSQEERSAALAPGRQVLVRLGHLIDHAVLVDVLGEEHAVGLAWPELFEVVFDL